MLVGIIGFVLAAIVVSSHGPESGLESPLGWLAPIVYVLVFHQLQSLLARKGHDLVIREAARGAPPAASRPFLLVGLQIVGLLAMLQLGWSQYVQGQSGFDLGELWLLPGALMFLPFFLVHVSWLAARRRIREALEPDPWPLPSYLAFHLRVLIIPLLPCILTSTIGWLSRRPTSANLLAAFPSIELVCALASGCLILLFSPLLMRLALRSRSLEAGPLRASLEAVAARGDFRFLDIRVAETHERIVNALFVGVAGRMRYVFLTDGILKKLDDEDLRGVFAHEMAHSRRGHIVLNMALLLGFSLMMQVLGQSGFGEEGGFAAGFLTLIALPLFIFLVFAPIMRTWETEADVYSGEILGDPGPIKRALLELGRLHPKRLREGGLTHPAIEQRLGFIDRYFGEKGVAEDFRARIKRLRRRVWLFFLLPLGLWLLLLPAEVIQGRIRNAVYEAERNDDVALAEKTLADLEPLIPDWVEDEDFNLRAALWTTIASGHQKRGALEEAAPWVERMKENAERFAGDPVKTYNAAVLEAQQEAGLGRLARMLPALRRAEEALDPIAELVGEDDEQVVRERRDLAFMRGLEELGRLLGKLPPAPGEAPLPEPVRPEEEALLVLVAAAREGALAPATTARECARLEPSWKRSALLGLAPSGAAEKGD